MKRLLSAPELAGVGLSLAILAFGASARAKGGAAAEAADKLFREAKALMSDSRFSEACPKLEESQRLDPATGTLLALAICHESEGRIATAYRELKQVLPATASEKRRDREALVQARLKDLAPRLPKIVVVIDSNVAATPGLTVRIDGERLEPTLYGTDVTVDPGAHTVEATSAVGDPFRSTTTVVERAVRRVVVPPFVAKAPVVADTPPPRREAPAFSQRTLGLVLASAGVIGVGVGAVFGVQAIQKSDDAKAICDPAACTDPRALSVNDDAKSAATLSTIAIGLGSAAIVGGAVVWLTAKPSKSAPVTAAPIVGPGQMGVSARATF